MARMVRPVTEVKRNATAIIARMREDREPVIVTEHGRAAAVLVDVESYEAMQRRIALLEAVARGERAFAEGRVVSHAAARRRLAKWRTKPR